MTDTQNIPLETIQWATVTGNIFRLYLFLFIFPTIGMMPGMAQVKCTSHPEYTILLPSGWIEIPKEVITAKVQELKQASKGGATIPNYERAYQMEESSTWFEYPYILVDVNRSGKIPSKDLDKLDQIDISSAKDKLINDFSDLISNAEFGKMHYEKGSYVAWLKTRFETAGSDVLEGISGMVLTNEGYIQISGFATQGDFATLIPIVQKMVRTTKISDRLKYSENLLDGVPFLSGVDWWSVFLAGLKGAIAGGFIVFVFAHFRNLVNRP